MKKSSTLVFSVLFSIASFAAFSPNRLTISSESGTNIKVLVDGDRFNQQVSTSSVVFENIQPGFHSIQVYQVNDRSYNVFGHRRGDDYRLLYSASIDIKPFFITSITLSRFGRAEISEQPMHEMNDDRRWNHRERDERRSDDDYYDQPSAHNGEYNRTSAYYRAISDADFFAAERVMDRENDNGRLLYAKRLIDDNYLDAQQVKELARFFSFDNCRLDFVEYAYSKTIDKNNFSVVSAAFSSSDGRSQVMHFLSTCK